MAMIFRQPGKTGIGVKAEDSASLENGKNCHGSSSKRKGKMKLNSVIFCLCAGLCSSTLIENAFSMNESRNLANKLCKIDKYSMMVASKYFENLDDFMNLEMVNKKFRGITNERFHYNPISITPDQLHLWPSLETLHLYTYKDIDAWIQAPDDIDYLHKIEVWPHILDRNAVEKMGKLKRLVAKSANENAKITFRNVTLACPETLGNFDEYGMYKFNENVYTNGKRGNANFVITLIDRVAFTLCTGLKSITIPNSVEYIGDHAFDGCDGLTSITIPNSVHSIGEGAFKWCDELTSIIIHNNIKLIGKQAFVRCEGLTSITIPDSVISIGNKAFKGCNNAEFTVPYNAMKEHLLKTSDVDRRQITVTGSTNETGKLVWPDDGHVTIPNSINSIDDHMFAKRYDIKSITISDGVQSIGNGAFSGCSRLTSIAIPGSVTYIGLGAFSGCSGLTSITIPDSVTYIGLGAFSDCENAKITVPYNAMAWHLVATSGISIDRITVTGSTNGTGEWAWRDDGKITIPDGLDSIDDAMFTNRVDIKSITIPNSVTSIGVSAFHKCTGLTSITIPNSVQLIGECAFWECEGLTSITIPDSVTSMDDDVFSDCIGLRSITISDSVKLIADYAFSGCEGLTSITIPDSVTSIGEYVFSGCGGLTSITIPDSVQSIGDSAFYGCDNLKKIYVYSDRVKDLVVNNTDVEWDLYIDPSIVHVIKK